MTHRPLYTGAVRRTPGRPLGTRCRSTSVVVGSVRELADSSLTAFAMTLFAFSIIKNCTMYLADFRAQRSKGAINQKSELVSTASCRISSFRLLRLSRLEQNLLNIFEQLLSSGAMCSKLMLTAVVEVHVFRDLVVNRHYFSESRKHIALCMGNKRFRNSFGGNFKQICVETCFNVKRLSYVDVLALGKGESSSNTP